MSVSSTSHPIRVRTGRRELLPVAGYEPEDATAENRPAEEKNVRVRKRTPSKAGMRRSEGADDASASASNQRENDERASQKPVDGHQIKPADGGETVRDIPPEPSAGADSGGHDPSRPIGPGNPPRDGQTRKGEVRNPYGRRGKRGGNAKAKPSSHDPVSSLDKVLAQKVSLTKNGKTIRVSAQHALDATLLDESLRGDDKARRRLEARQRIELSKKRQAAREPVASDGMVEPLTSEEAGAIIEIFLACGGAERFQSNVREDRDPKSERERRFAKGGSDRLALRDAGEELLGRATGSECVEAGDVE